MNPARARDWDRKDPEQEKLGARKQFDPPPSGFVDVIDELPLNEASQLNPVRRGVARQGWRAPSSQGCGFGVPFVQGSTGAPNRP